MQGGRGILEEGGRGDECGKKGVRISHHVYFFLFVLFIYLFFIEKLGEMRWAEQLLLLLLHIYLGPWWGAPFFADWRPRFERRVLVQLILYKILEKPPSPAFEKLVRVRKKRTKRKERKKESGPDPSSKNLFVQKTTQTYIYMYASPLSFFR